MSTETIRANPLLEQARAAYDEFVSLFSNVLFAVSLFGVWGVLTLIGVIVDQNKEPAAYAAEYGAPPGAG